MTSVPPSGASAEMLGQPMPAVEIVLLSLRRVQRESGRPDDITTLEHECERVLELLRRQRGFGRPLKSLCVRAVTGHAVVQACAAWHEPIRLRVVSSLDETHELA